MDFCTWYPHVKSTRASCQLPGQNWRRYGHFCRKKARYSCRRGNSNGQVCMSTIACNKHQDFITIWFRRWCWCRLSNVVPGEVRPHQSRAKEKQCPTMPLHTSQENT